MWSNPGGYGEWQRLRTVMCRASDRYDETEQNRLSQVFGSLMKLGFLLLKMTGLLYWAGPQIDLKPK